MSEEKRKAETIGKLDHMFELVLVLWSIILGAFFQFLTWLYPKSESTTIVFTALPILVVSLFVVIFVWLWKTLTKNENLKMFLRIMAWVWGIFLSWFYVMMIMNPCVFGLGVRDMTLAGGLFVGGAMSLLSFLMWTAWKIAGRYEEASPDLLIWQNWKMRIGTWIAVLVIVLFWAALLRTFVDALIRSTFPPA